MHVQYPNTSVRRSRCATFARTIVGLLLLMAVFAAEPAVAQHDSVRILPQSGGAPYKCCYDFIVFNGHGTPGVRISEFRVRILSGNATIVTGAGEAEAPPDWTIFIADDLKNVSWFAQTTSSELDSGESIGGFRICVQDTGVFRMQWQTRSFDSTLTTDTVAFVCRRDQQCGEAFFRQIPSNEECAFNIDMINGTRNRTVNRLSLEIVTPSVTLRRDGGRVPAGWRRTDVDTARLNFTTTGGLRYEQFIEGFAVRFDADHDSTFRVVYRLMEFDQVLCFDTVTLRCRPLIAVDTVSISNMYDSCCHDVRIVNSHRPASRLDRVRFEVVTPNVRITRAPDAPAGWTRVGFSNDTILYTRSPGLNTGDSVIFRGLCFDNSLAANDSIHYEFRIFGDDVAIESGTVALYCRRELIFCDSVQATVDPTFPSSTRCVDLRVRNTNSLGEPINRVAFKIANPGTPRVLISSSAPPGWSVATSGPDSVVFTGGRILDNGYGDFRLCLSLGDGATRDPVSITWRTGAQRGPLCEGTIPVNAILNRTCDSVAWVEVPSTDPTQCCFDLTFANRNDQNRPIDGLLFRVARSNVIFADATAADGWTLTTADFPNVEVGFQGGPLAAGSDAVGFRLCINASQLPPTRPITIPVVWRSFSSTGAVCFDTVRLVCSGQVEQQCDTIELSGHSQISERACEMAFTVTNTAVPAARLDTVVAYVENASGRIFEAVAPAGWSVIALQDDRVVFAGGDLASNSSASFTVRMDNLVSATADLRLETRRDSKSCAQSFNIECRTSAVQLADRRAATSLHEAVPNPTGGRATIGYTLGEATNVTISVHDERGMEVLRVPIGLQPAGDHTAVLELGHLPGGTYFYSLVSDDGIVTRRLLLIR